MKRTFQLLASFAAPVILMATVSPFAVRLKLRRAMEGVEAAGRTAGSLSSLSTLGSIVGTFLPVLVLIPTFGSEATLYLDRGRYGYAEVELHDRSGEMTIGPASDANVALALGRLATVGNNLDIARMHAEQVIALAPSLPAG